MIATKADLMSRLMAEGFQPGPPPHIQPVTLAIDRLSCRRCKCAHCRNRGLRCVPMHKGPRYKVVAVCDACGHEDER